MHLLQDKINQLLSETSDETAVLIQELNQTQPIFEKDSQHCLVSASTIKIFIMCCALNEVMHQRSSLMQRIQVTENDILSDSQVFEHGADNYSMDELIRWMMISSDNTATNVLIRTLTMETINHYIQHVLHLKHTRLERIMLDYDAIARGYNNYTSQQDQMKIYAQLFNHEILNDELCELALEILYSQRDKSLLMRYLPYPVPFAHKTGGLDYLIHDCGVMTINKKKYYIGISVYNCKEINGNTKLVGTIGKLVHGILSK